MITVILIAVYGIIIGSFLSMCIYRVPRADSYYIEEGDEDLEGNKLEIPTPVGFNEPKRSICPNCNNQLLWWHNIPVVSWLLLRGKCFFCKTKISVRYPLVELLSCGTAVLTYYHYGLTWTALIIFIFLASLIVISFIDYDYYIIPDVISIPGTLIGIIISCLNQFTNIFSFPINPTFYSSMLGFLAGAGFLYLVAEIYLKLRKIDGLGLGDVKLLAMTGTLFGPECSLYTIFIGSLVGSVCGFLLMIFRGRSFKQHLPFGPYLAIGTFLYIFSGMELVYYLTDYINLALVNFG